MPTTSKSKQTGTTQWLLVRISGVILLFLLLAHFWVHHFFIKDFYGEVNVVDVKMDQKSLIDYNPMWGKESGLYIDGIQTELKGTDYFLDASSVTGPTPITVVVEPERTEILRGHLSPKKVSTLLDRQLDDATVKQVTINPKQIKTKHMINYDDVHDRVGGDGWIWWKTYNLLFLTLAIYHGFAGIWDVITDYKMSSMTRITLYSLINTLGLIFFIVGVLIIVPM